MEWPETNETTGKPQTTRTNQSILLAAASAAQDAEKVALFRERVRKCKNWRSEYMGIMDDFVRLQAEASPDICAAMCRAGLQQAQDSFVYRLNGNETVSLTQAFAMKQNALKTLSLFGSKSTHGNFELASPYGTDTNPLWVTGDHAIAQIKAWESYGCMEPSAAQHAIDVCQKEHVSELVENKTFCLLGVTSQMGPAYSLLKIPGSHVIGVARWGSKMEQLMECYKREGARGSTLQVPDGGANLLEQIPEIAQWIVDTAPADKELVLIPLAYMDGEACVRVTVAMDAIIGLVMEKRKDVSLAFLISPATSYAIPKKAAEDAKSRYNKGMSFPKIVSLASFGTLAKPTNVWTQENEVNNLAILNGMVHLQGPNYALAKMMQQWRCMSAHAAGIRVVAPHAPATRTYSVVHSAQAAAGLEGLNYFPPMLAFDVYPCSSLLTAILLNQLASERPFINHPMELFWDGSVHGGSWRFPYSVDSVAAIAYILGCTVSKNGSSPSTSLAPDPRESKS